jgi:hypothetical protein
VRGMDAAMSNLLSDNLGKEALSVVRTIKLNVVSGSEIRAVKSGDEICLNTGANSTQEKVEDTLIQVLQAIL